MNRIVSGIVFAGMVLLGMVGANAQTPIQIYGAWHCYSDACSWASVPNMTTFDTDNRWLIDSQSGRHLSSFGEPGDAEFRRSGEVDESHDRLDHHEGHSHRDDDRGDQLFPEPGRAGDDVDWRLQLYEELGEGAGRELDRSLGSTLPMRPSNSMWGWRLITKRAAIRI